MADRLSTGAVPTAAQVPHLVSVAAAAEAWNALEEGFARVANTQSDQVRTSWWRIGGREVHGRVAGQGLAARVGLAFPQLRAEDWGLGSPELAIDLWDGEATGVPLTAGTILDDIPGWHDGGGISTVSEDSRYYVHSLFESRVILDRKARRILGWTASSERMSLYERGKPLRVPLSVWLHDRGVQVVHAALVARNARGVLLPGRGGSGKSTSALACLLAGLDYLGDDYVGLERQSDGSFTGHGLYDSTWLDPDHLLRFPTLAPHAIRGVISWERKRLVHLSQVFPERLAQSVPIRVLALPRVAHVQTTRSRPASKAEALLRMAPTSVFELTPRVGAQGFQGLAALAAQVPAYWLELGEELSDIPACIDDLLARTLE